MRNVEKSAGDWLSFCSSSTETMPAPFSSTRSRSAVSNSGSPKKTSPPCAESSAILRRMTPTVAFDAPPMPSSSALPSSEVR